MIDGSRRGQLTLITRFNLITLALLLVISAVIGLWISRIIETKTIDSIGHTTSLFAGSVVSPALARYVRGRIPAESAEEEFSGLFDESRHEGDIVAYKVWDLTGRIVYSTYSEEIGRVYPPEGGLARAMTGEFSAEISLLEKDENVWLKRESDKLLEIYSPVREPGSGEIIGVAEFYQSTETVEAAVNAARLQIWLIVLLVVVVIYTSLIALIRGGNRTITRQRAALETQLEETRLLLAKNRTLRRRIGAAAARNTDLMERHFRNLAADLHDGPGQDISYALLTMDRTNRDFDTPKTREALEKAMEEIREISSGLKTPDLHDVPLGAVVALVVRRHRQRTGAEASVTLSNLPEDGTAALKIAVYRVIQEALSNSFKHADEQRPEVEVVADSSTLTVVVSDSGAGFGGFEDAAKNGHLGVPLMKERVEMLGGEFVIEPRDGGGTSVRSTFSLEGTE